MKVSWRSSLIALLCTLVPAALWAQGITAGSINGTVEDQQHAVISGAAVTAIQHGTNVKYTAQSTSSGYFNFASLPVGTYDLSIEAPKFSKLTVNNVPVNAGVPTGLGARILGLGSETTVTVEDTAPLVQTDSVNIANTFDTKKAANLPIGNGFDTLALFSPGVADSADNTFSNSNGPGISSNGQRGRSNNFQIDGQNNNDNSVAGPSIFLGNQDLISEVQVLTNYDAQYGRNMGSVVNYVTKQGTNAYHGTAYEYYNGNWADSYTNEEKNPLFGFCLSGQDPATTGCQKPVHPRYVDNRFGGTLGGPILKDKLWFFGSGHFERQRVGATLFNSGGAILPTPAGIQQLDALFPGNVGVSVLKNIGPQTITSSGTPTYADLQNLLVSNVAGANCDPTAGPVDPSCVGPVQFGTINRPLQSLVNDYETSGRIDYQISSKDRFFGRYFFQQTANNSQNVGDPAGGTFVNIPVRNQQIGLDWVRDWTNNFLNQARFSYSRSRVFFEGGAYPNCVASALGNCPTYIVFNDITENFGLNDGFPQGRLINVYSYQDNATWQRGRHTIKFGGEFDRQRSPNVFLPDTNGRFVFNTFTDFLANSPSGVLFGAGDPVIRFKENDVAWYAQDEWRARDNLTLTLGVRWEWEQQAINHLHDETVARESNPATAFWDTTVPLQFRTVPHVAEDLNNFGPVVGFAYTPRIWKSIFGDDKTVIRGGFRIAYDPAFYNIFLNVANTTPTVDTGQLLSCNGCLPASGSGADAHAAILPQFPFGANPGQNSWTTVSPNFHNPYTEQWQLGVQREISRNVVGEVRYVGNHDVGLFMNNNGNPALQPLIDAGFGNLIPKGLTPCVNPAFQGTKAVFGFVDCAHTNVITVRNTGFSNYNAVQSQLRMSNWHGVSAGLSYTFSHTIDNASEIFNTLAGGNTVAYTQSPFDYTPERANSGLDFPHVASLYVVWDTPWYKNQQGVLGHLLGGWELNPTWRYTSGQPWTVVESRHRTGLLANTLCDPSGTYSLSRTACRPILANSSQPVDTVGLCTDATLPDCGLQNFYTGAPVSASAVHWIYNDNVAAQFFGSPFLGAARNLQRGDAVNTTNLALLKNVKINERWNVQLHAVLYNAMNHMFRGAPQDPNIDHGNFADTQGPFGNTFFNTSGGLNTNPTFDGVGRRRLEVGAKIIF